MKPVGKSQAARELVTGPSTPKKPGWVRRSVRRVIVVGAYCYPSILLALCLALTCAGEDWWLTAGLLYLPRALFAAPLCLFVPGLWLLGRRGLLWTQALALTLVLFPLMGLVLPGPTGGATGQSFKLLSFNVNSGYSGAERLMAAVDATKADLVLFQEAPEGDADLLAALKTRFAHVETSTQFVIASRFAIVETTDPDKVPMLGRARSPRFMRYVVDTNFGKLAVYNLHPISPRGTLGIHRTRGLLHRVRTGEIFEGDPEADLGQNAELRAAQIATAASLAAKESLPVLLAGDTNLPGLSAALRRSLSGYTDAFRQGSWGFGYTFPARHPFLRLDRILGGTQLAFADFRVGCPDVSDHLCVAVQVIRR